MRKVSFHYYDSKEKLDNDILLKVRDYGDIVFLSDSEFGELVWTHGKYFNSFPDLSNLLTQEEFASLTSGLLKQKSLATINGQTIEEGGNIDLYVSLFEIVEELPETDIETNKIYLKKDEVTIVNGTNTETETVLVMYIYSEIDGWVKIGSCSCVITIPDMSLYLTKNEATQMFMPKSGSTTNPDSGSSGGGASLSISQTGSFNNYGDNGQAFNAVRDLSQSSSNKNEWKANTGSGYPLNAASFGVKNNGNTAFSHKKYDTFNKDTGIATGAKNTAVLCFSGKAGLLYAKNTGTANDVTDAMYKRVGVIDSPDEDQKVYSAKQVDDIIKTLTDRIEVLEAALVEKTS